MASTRLDSEKRKRSALERLGTDHPVCVICGENDWRCLELHHISGRTYGEESALVCRNCHRKLSDTQHDHPPAVQDDPSTAEKIGRYLLGLADLLEAVVATLRQFGEWLIEFARRLTSGDRAATGA